MGGEGAKGGRGISGGKNRAWQKLGYFLFVVGGGEGAVTEGETLKTGIPGSARGGIALVLNINRAAERLAAEVQGLQAKTTKRGREAARYNACGKRRARRLVGGGK